MKTRKIIQGSFYEEFNAARSYRGVLLVMNILLMLASAMEAFFAIDNWTGQLSCDNKFALYQSMWGLGRIKTSAEFADPLRNIFSSGNWIRGQLVSKHVDGYIDRYPLWNQLTI